MKRNESENVEIKIGTRLIKSTCGNENQRLKIRKLKKDTLRLGRTKIRDLNKDTINEIRI